MNYKILGSDQKEYGPVELAQLRQWLADGRVNAQTMVQAEGSPEWKPLASFPELAPLSSTAPTPFTPQAEPGKDPAAMVRTPAILLMVTGGLGVLGGLVNLGFRLFNVGFSLANFFPPEVRQQIEQAMRMSQASAIGIPAALFGLALSGFLFFGGLSMNRLERYGLVMAAAIIAMPCGNTCCCPIGLAAGIWALIMLTKPEVKAAFH